MIPPQPANEAERLSRLRELEIMDTPAEADFDELVRLAAEICDVPIALISLIDERRQWFKAKTGIDATETTRDSAFCAHALDQGTRPLIVRDALADDRFAANPLVTGDPNIRFYAGAPLIMPTGEALGTLCVIDRVPRELTGRQVQALGILSNQVITQMRLRRQLREQQRMEQALALNEQRLHYALEGSDQGVWDWNLLTNEVYFSPRWCDQLGYAPEEISNRLEEWSSRVHPDDLGPALTLIRDHMEGRMPLYLAEMRIRTKAGAYRWIMDRGQVVARDESGKPTRMVGTHIDITARREAEEALRRREAELLEAQRLARMGDWWFDLRTGEVHWSEEIFRMQRLPPAAKPPLLPEQRQHFTPESWDRLTAAMQVTQETGRPYELELEMVRSDGSHGWMLARGECVHDHEGKVVALRGIAQDVTARVQAELERVRLLAVLESSLNEIYVFDAHTFALEFVNEAARLNLGYTQEEIRRMTALDVGHGFSRESMVEVLSPLSRNEKPKLVVETWHHRKDGTAYPVESHLQKVVLDGKPVFLGMVIDVTERRQAERRLREQAALIDEAHDGIVVRDLDHRIRFWSKGAERMYGWTADEARGRVLSELLAADTAVFASADAAVREKGSWSGEISKRTRGGAVLAIDCRWTLLRSEDGQPQAILSFDIDGTAERSWSNSSCGRSEPRASARSRAESRTTSTISSLLSWSGWSC